MRVPAAGVSRRNSTAWPLLIRPLSGFPGGLVVGLEELGKEAEVEAWVVNGITDPFSVLFGLLSWENVVGELEE